MEQNLHGEMTVFLQFYRDKKTTVIERSGIGLFSYQDPEVKHSAYCFVISVKSDPNLSGYVATVADILSL